MSLGALTSNVMSNWLKEQGKSLNIRRSQIREHEELSQQHNSGIKDPGFLLSYPQTGSLGITAVG